jgi:hypothetical protein
MSVNEILVELDTMSADDLKIIQERIDLLRSDEDFKETPEMLAVIDDGLRSLREEGTITIEELREKMKSWNFKSP